MNLISVDLGTTNINTAVYDQSLQMLHLATEPVAYQKNEDFVEFDAEQYFSLVLSMIQQAAACGWQKNGKKTAQIVLTGQAESLILLDQNHRPVCPGISWMDMRSLEECSQLSAVFSQT